MALAFFNVYPHDLSKPKIQKIVIIGCKNDYFGLWHTFLTISSIYKNVHIIHIILQSFFFQKRQKLTATLRKISVVKTQWFLFSKITKGYFRGGNGRETRHIDTKVMELICIVHELRKTGDTIYRYARVLHYQRNSLQLRFIIR